MTCTLHELSERRAAATLQENYWIMNTDRVSRRHIGFPCQNSFIRDWISRFFLKFVIKSKRWQNFAKIILWKKWNPSATIIDLLIINILKKYINIYIYIYIIQCDAIRWEQFLRRCRLGQAKAWHRFRTNDIKTKIWCSNFHSFDFIFFERVSLTDNPTLNFKRLCTL